MEENYGGVQKMDLKINKKTGDGEMLFSWKEIWILIKHKKFVIPNQFFDQFLSALIDIKTEMMKKQNDPTIEDDKNN